MRRHWALNKSGRRGHTWIRVKLDPDLNWFGLSISQINSVEFLTLGLNHIVHFYLQGADLLLPRHEICMPCQNHRWKMVNTIQTFHLSATMDRQQPKCNNNSIIIIIIAMSEQPCPMNPYDWVLKNKRWRWFMFKLQWDKLYWWDDLVITPRQVWAVINQRQSPWDCKVSYTAGPNG